MRHSAVYALGAPFLLGALSMCLPAIDSGISLEVRVVDWMDLPVTGAHVTFEPQNERVPPYEIALERGTGSYHFATKARTGGRVVVRALGYASDAARWQPLDGDVLEFYLQAPARIGGTVKSLDGSPIAGVHIWGSARRNCRVREQFIDDATSAADGQFLLSALRRNDWGPPALHFSAPGYAERSSPAILDDEEMEVFLVREVDEPVVAEPDSPIDKSSTAALAVPSDAFSGRVIDADGFPVASVRVLLGYTGDSPPAELDHAIAHGDDDECVVCSGIRTGTDGRFCVRGLPPFSRYALLAIHDRRLLGSVCELAFDGEACIAQVEVVLSRSGTILGRVVDASGGDFAHVDVSASCLSADRDLANSAKGGVQLWRDRDYEKGLYLSSYTSTDTRGNYEFTGFEPGTYSISVSRRGYVSPIAQRVRVESGATTLAETFVFPKGHAVSGVLIDRAQQPIIGEQVMLLGISGDSAETLTDRAGCFHFSGIPTGVYEAHIWRSGNAWLRQRVELPHPAPLELELPTPARLAVRVVLPNGRFADGGFGKLNRLGTTDYEYVELDETGRFRIEIRPDVYVLEVDIDESTLTSQRVRIEAGTTTSMVLSLAHRTPPAINSELERIAIRGRVSAAGRPVANASVNAVPPTSEDGDEVSSWTDAEGRYTIELPRSGAWWLQVNFCRDAKAYAPTECALIVPVGVDAVTRDFELLPR